MIALLFLLGAVLGVAGGWLGCHRRHRARTADLELQADNADWFQIRADQLAVLYDDASHAVTTLRAVVADQAVIVRAALGRPQKRRIPGGTR